MIEENNNDLIQVKDLSLWYRLHIAKENTLKGRVMNFIHRRSYPSEPITKFQALKNLNFCVKKGERLGVIGRNGAGKSTLLKVLAGIIKPQDGHLFIDGPVQPLIEIGAGFNPELSGRENIYLNGYMLGFSKSEIKAKEKEIIDFTELAQFIDMPIKYYSTGMSVRLAFAIATSVNPHILLFDEMLGAGDAGFSAKAQRRLNALIDRAKCIVLVSHDLNLIRNFCHRVIVLDKGEAVFDGASAEAVDHYLQLSDGGG